MESLKALKPSADDQTKDASSSSEETFINTGLQKWELGRRQWLDYSGITPTSSAISQSDQSRCFPSSKKKKKGATNLNVDKIIDLVVSNRWRLATKGGQKEKEKATFDKPVPLPQMVDILADLWEAEGMDV